MTISEAFGPAVPTATIGGNTKAAPDRARVHARMRAREYRSLPVVGKVAGIFADWAVQAWADLRAAWWTPASLPTLARAWSERMPDRERVPGNNGLLFGGWVLYSHTVGLAVPAAVAALVGVLAPVVWAARHPARLALMSLIVCAATALILN